MPSQGPSSSPSLSARPTTMERCESEDPSRSHCNCGNGDRPGHFVLCDNDDCKVGWYHWECVRVVEEPVGTWLCPSCSPNDAFYAKQLVQKQEAPPLVPKAEKADKPAGSRVRQQEQDREQVPALGIREREVAKKGIAVKRPAAPKPKPRWVGWVELSSEGEEDFRKRVDAQWSVDNVISVKRRSASKAVGEDTETGSRTLRRHSRVGWRKRAVETDSDEDEGESVHQQQEQEAEEEEQQQEGPVHRKASVIDMVSDDSDDSEYAMDVDMGADDADEDSTDKLSDPHSDSGEERHISPDQIRADSISHRDRKTKVSEAEPEDLEDSMDIEYQDKILEANSSHGSDVSEYVDANEYIDDDEASEAPRTHVSASHGRGVAVSPVMQVSERVSRRADTTNVDAENHGHEVQDLDAVSPAVESNNRAPLYQRQGNCWGEFPESAIRSTLPRLA